MPPLAPYFFLLVAVLSWAGNYVLAGGIHEQISPVSLAFFRWLLACLILFPFAIRRAIAQRRLIRRHIGLLTLLGFFSVTAFNTLIYQSLQTSTVVNIVLINATTPIVIIGLSRLLFPRPLGYRQICGTVLSFCGILVILARSGNPGFAGFRPGVGDLWTLSAVMCWALYSVLLRRLPAVMDSTGAMLVMFVSGLLLLAPVYAWERVAIGSGPSLTPVLWGSVVYLAVFSSILGYWCWNRAVAMIGARRAGPFLHLSPILSVLGAVLFISETFQASHLAALLMILSGVGIAQYVPARAR
jgi:drug/metabolite transporter (DMT)-like permease